MGSCENGFRDAGRVFVLENVAKVRFGRSSGEDALRCERQYQTGGRAVLQVGIPLGWVSGVHAELSVSTDGGRVDLELRDLGSRNGTLVERKKISSGTRLHPQQVFEIGRSFWTVYDAGVPGLEGRLSTEVDPAGTCVPQMCHIHAQLGRLAESDVPLLLRGETGTGKEVTARAIHRLSGRRGPIMCARLSTLPAQRVESLLFGHRRGAFPGAEEDQPGLFEEADGGTLLMDDLGELSPEVQAKLLRAIDERQVNRIGEDAPRRFDVRVICTTLHDVHAMVQSERFRPDLYARLAGFEVELPPLRDRRGDLGLLTRFLMRAQGGDRTRLATRAFRRLLSHRWPFNVRELAQTLATATILAGEEGEITNEIVEEILDRRRDIPQTPSRVQELRSELIARLVEHGGNTVAVAQAMSCDTEDIRRWIERFDLTADTFKH